MNCKNCITQKCLGTYFKNGKLCKEVELQFLKKNNNGIKIYPSKWIRKRLSNSLAKKLKQANIEGRTWREIPFSSSKLYDVGQK